MYNHSEILQISFELYGYFLLAQRPALTTPDSVTLAVALKRNRL